MCWAAKSWISVFGHGKLVENQYWSPWHTWVLWAFRLLTVTGGGEQNYLSRKSTQFKDSLKRTKSATKLDQRTPDVAIVSNGSATLDDRSVTVQLESHHPNLDL